MKKLEWFLLAFVLFGLYTLGNGSDVQPSPKVTTRKNSTGSDFARRRLNLIEGSGVTITMSDDPTNNEIDTTIASTGGGGGASTLEVLAGVERTSPTVTIGFPAPQFTGSVTSSSMTVNLDPSSVTLCGAQIDLSGTEATGTLAAGRFPALTGDITTSAGSLATTAATNQGNIKVFTSSVTFTSPSGTLTSYGATVGSITVNDLTASQIVVTDANKKLASQSVLYSTVTLQFKCTGLDRLETNFAVNTATNTGTNNYLTCSFDNSTRQYVNGFFMVPNNLDTGGTITIRTTGRSSTAASSKNVAWVLEHQPLANAEAITSTFLNSDSNALSVSATQGNQDVLSWTMSVSSSTWVANDLVYFRFSRDVNVTNNLASPYYTHWITVEIPVTESPSR